jgi:tetratricopeptide (TPR) repeat protein
LRRSLTTPLYLDSRYDPEMPPNPFHGLSLIGARCMLSRPWNDIPLTSEPKKTGESMMTHRLSELTISKKACISCNGTDRNRWVNRLIQGIFSRQGEVVVERTAAEGCERRHPALGFEVEAGLHRDLAEVCTGLAALDAHEGRLADAMGAGETACSLWQGLSNEAPDDWHYRDRLAGALGTLGRVYARLGRTTDADGALRQAIALSEALTDQGAASATTLLTASAARSELASLLTYLGRYQVLSRLYEENCDRLTRALAGGDNLLELRLELLKNLCWLARQYQHDGNPARADRCWRQGYDLGRRLSEEAPDSPSAVYNLATCSRELTLKDPVTGRPEETARL